MTTRSAELDLYCDAQGDGGLFDETAIAAAGLSVRTARRRRAEGAWVEVVPTVYVAAGARLDVDVVERAALRWLAPFDVRLSHLSAGRRRGWDVPVAPDAWVSVPRPLRLPQVRGLRVHRTRHPGPTARVDGLPVTTAARTVVDLGQLLSRVRLLDVFTEAVRRRETTVDLVLRMADRLHHRAGTGLVRAVASELGEGHESVLEQALARGFAQRGICHWRPQHRILDGAGAVLARADFADPAARLVVETDGFAYHGSRDQQRRDKARDRRIAALGWLTLRYGTDDVIRRLSETLEEIEAVRASRLFPLAR